MTYTEAFSIQDSVVASVEVSTTMEVVEESVCPYMKPVEPSNESSGKIHGSFQESGGSFHNSMSESCLGGST